MAMRAEGQPEVGELPILDDPDAIYAQLFTGESFVPKIDGEAYGDILAAYYDIIPANRRADVPPFPSEESLTLRLYGNPSLADLHLAAAHLDGHRDSLAGKAGFSIGKLVTRALPLLADVRAASRSSLAHEARKWVRWNYGGTEHNGEAQTLAPFLWADLILGLMMQSEQITQIRPEVWERLAERYAASFDRAVAHSYSLYPGTLLLLRRDIADPQVGPLWAIQRFADDKQRPTRRLRTRPL